MSCFHVMAAPTAFLQVSGFILFEQGLGNQGNFLLQLKAVMLFQAAGYFILIALTTTVGISQTLDLVLVSRVAARRAGRAFTGAQVAALGFSFVVSTDIGYLFNFIFLSLDFCRSCTWLDLMQENNAENLNYWVKDCYL